MVFPWGDFFPWSSGPNTVSEGTVKFLFLAAKEQTGHGSYAGFAAGKPRGCSDFLFSHVLGIIIPADKYFSSLLDHLQASGEIHNHRLVYRLLHRIGRKKGQPPAGPKSLPLLKKADGTIASTFEEQQRTWLQQFAQIEAGITITWKALQTQNDGSREQDQPADLLEPKAIPTAWQIQTVLGPWTTSNSPRGHESGW